jgi:hypothetical protein
MSQLVKCKIPRSTKQMNGKDITPSILHEGLKRERERWKIKLIIRLGSPRLHGKDFGWRWLQHNPFFVVRTVVPNMTRRRSKASMDDTVCHFLKLVVKAKSVDSASTKIAEWRRTELFRCDHFFKDNKIQHRVSTLQRQRQ